ncbi:hypothetical protein J4E06_02855 [Muricauda sp. NFXS6]|uniref:hypothetical protein n=1 Tax=Allomuricauda sp. NFXS6 TaxID=2819094 RepID=UPI0032DEEABC
MKNWFKHITILFAGVALLATSCDDGDAVIDEVTAETTRGAILRTVAIDQNEVIFDLDNSVLVEGGFSATVEVQDTEGGDLLSEIEVYGGFRDNTSDGVDDRAEVLLETIPASEGVPGEFGLPRFTYSAGYEELQQALDLPGDAFFGGDQFTVRFELVLTDGRRFSFDDNTGTITGSFFSSPFLYTANVVCFVPDGYFEGEYSITQNSGSGPFDIFDGFSQPSVTVEANSMTGRSIGFTYDPGGFDSAYTFTFDLVCGEIQNFSGTINSGSLGCDGSSIGQTAVANVEYDVEDDSEFTILIEDFNPDGGCGGTYEASLTFTKL